MLAFPLKAANFEVPASVGEPFPPLSLTSVVSVDFLLLPAVLVPKKRVPFGKLMGIGSLLAPRGDCSDDVEALPVIIESTPSASVRASVFALLLNRLTVPEKGANDGTEELVADVDNCDAAAFKSNELAYK